MERISNPIRYSSTNRAASDRAEPVSFREALFQGLASDQGLFLPTRIPQLSSSDLAELRGQSYATVAATILWPYLGSEIDAEKLRQICESAYDFPVPLEYLPNFGHLLRLDQGPTASFKDFAARLMARLMEQLRPGNQEITILVATSGDTGSAVGEAYRGLDGIRVYILYPRDEVSSVQKKQLDSIGLNVQAIEVTGKFDDCQRLVKMAFSDPALRPLQLTSANSINIGRILPQMIYYFFAWLARSAEPEPVIYVVPSGNFGNAFGCEIARRMGLPVKKLILAVNANDEFPKFLASGDYQVISPSRACLSNAMNVGNPSNLARFFDLYGGHLDKDGGVHRSPEIARLKQYITSFSISDAATIAMIRQAHQRWGILVEPHGAVGLAALERYRLETACQTPAICLETAHPAKFPEIIEQELGITPPQPESMHRIMARPGQADQLSVDYARLREYLLDRHSPK
jgi:threonine synthase